MVRASGIMLLHSTGAVFAMLEYPNWTDIEDAFWAASSAPRLQQSTSGKVRFSVSGRSRGERSRSREYADLPRGTVVDVS